MMIRSSCISPLWPSPLPLGSRFYDFSVTKYSVFLERMLYQTCWQLTGSVYCFSAQPFIATPHGTTHNTLVPGIVHCLSGLLVSFVTYISSSRHYSHSSQTLYLGYFQHMMVDCRLRHMTEPFVTPAPVFERSPTAHTQIFFICFQCSQFSEIERNTNSTKLRVYNVVHTVIFVGSQRASFSCDGISTVAILLLVLLTSCNEMILPQSSPRSSKSTVICSQYVKEALLLSANCMVYKAERCGVAVVGVCLD